jgi:hypothetical protein
MAKKLMLGGVVLILLAVGIFISMRRSQMMGSGIQNESGGLIAVLQDGSLAKVPPAAKNLPENSAMQELDGMLVTLTLSPYPPNASRTTNFDVTITDQNGQPVTEAVISLDLTMPSMYMPPNQVNLGTVGNGNYASPGRFTMRGMWRIEVMIDLDGQKRSVFF